jgi:uncharacterized protein (DUF1501 family)
MSTRRQFLQQSALVSLTPLVPSFLARSAMAASGQPDERVLVVIQLDGGNDGLNTVIPFADPLYARYRRELRIRTDQVIKLDDAVGLHPQMKPAAELLEDGRLAIVHGVGYPNPNRSHFESMAIWHHARLDSRDHDSIGWLGRAADGIKQQSAKAGDSVYLGSEAVPVALRGRRASNISLQDESDLKLTAPISSTNSSPGGASDVAAFVQRSLADSFDAARRFEHSSAGAAASKDKYPQSKLGEKLRLVSKLLKLGGRTRIYYLSQSGYDTHAAQLFTHLQLLDEFADALKAFLDDLKSAKLDDRVVVLAFSEFGRRVEENGSAGTDHGAAGPVFLAGAPVRAGVIGEHPSLADLDQGDLKMTIDFRRVYAGLLQPWLRVDAASVLGQSFEPLACVKTG